jgi:hypothetical protein
MENVSGNSKKSSHFHEVKIKSNFRETRKVLRTSLQYSSSSKFSMDCTVPQRGEGATFTGKHVFL